MTIDKERLRVLAEAVKDWSDYNQYQHPGEFLKLAEFYVAASPAAVLALLSENAALAAEVERTANNREMWKAQCAAQAKELERLRKDGPALARDLAIQYANGHQVDFDAAIDAAMADKGGAES